MTGNISLPTKSDIIEGLTKPQVSSARTDHIIITDIELDRNPRICVGTLAVLKDPNGIMDSIIGRVGEISYRDGTITFHTAYIERRGDQQPRERIACNRRIKGPGYEILTETLAKDYIQTHLPGLKV